MCQSVAERKDVLEWAAGLQALHERIAGRFGRREPRRRALACLKGVAGAGGAQEWVAVGGICRRCHPGRGATVVGHLQLGC